MVIFLENRNLIGLGLGVLHLDGVHDELHAALDVGEGMTVRVKDDTVLEHCRKCNCDPW